MCTDPHLVWARWCQLFTLHNHYRVVTGQFMNAHAELVAKRPDVIPLSTISSTSLVYWKSCWCIRCEKSGMMHYFDAFSEEFCVLYVLLHVVFWNDVEWRLKLGTALPNFFARRPAPCIHMNEWRLPCAWTLRHKRPRTSISYVGETPKSCGSNLYRFDIF